MYKDFPGPCFQVRVLLRCSQFIPDFIGSSAATDLIEIFVEVMIDRRTFHLLVSNEHEIRRYK